MNSKLSEAIATYEQVWTPDFLAGNPLPSAMMEAARCAEKINALPVGAYTLDRIDKDTWWVGVCIGEDDNGSNIFETIGKGTLPEALRAALDKIGGVK